MQQFQVEVVTNIFRFNPYRYGHVSQVGGGPIKGLLKYIIHKSVYHSIWKVKDWHSNKLHHARRNKKVSVSNIWQLCFRNRSNYPVYCEPPVVTNNKLCQNQSNRNSIQSSFNLTNFGDKYGKYEATTTIDDDDDGEVSYYMMNEMVRI